MTKEALKVINHVNDLPSWFDIDNYDELENFSFGQWVEVIGERYTMNLLFESGGIELLEALEHTPSKIFSEPITSVRYPDTPANARHPFTTPSVKSLSFQDAAAIGIKIVKVTNLPIIRKALELGSDDSAKLSSLPYDFLMKKASRSRRPQGVPDNLKPDKSDNFEYPNNPDAHLVIDLSASDNQILKDIQTWLNEYRKASKLPQASNAHYFDRREKNWLYWRVVPYLDLFLWSKISGVSIKKSVIIFSIFYGSDYEKKKALDTLSKSTIPAAQELLTEYGWDSLHSRSYPESNI